VKWPFDDHLQAKLDPALLRPLTDDCHTRLVAFDDDGELKELCLANDHDHGSAVQTGGVQDEADPTIPSIR